MFWKTNERNVFRTGCSPGTTFSETLEFLVEIKIEIVEIIAKIVSVCRQSALFAKNQTAKE